MRKLQSQLLSAVLLLPLLTTGYAQEPKTPVHPIDRFLESCMDKDPSTAGMTRCTDQAAARWDKEMNQRYATLMRQLPDDGKKALKAAQLTWIKHRDTEFKLIDRLYSRLQGTMYIPMRASNRLKVVKQRALELASYSNLLEL